MMRLVFIFFIWIIAYFKSDWRNWRNYHPTILFMIAANFLIGLITYKYTLWDLSSELGGHIFNDLLLSLFFFPASMLIYLKYFPYSTKGWIKKILFILGFAILFTLIEEIEYLLDNINYANGWNLLKSFYLNIGMLTVLAVHHKNPLLAYFLFFLEVIALIIICEIPVSEFK